MADHAARALLEEGIALLESSNLDKAASVFAEAASIASQEGNRLLEARAYANIGSVCASRQDHLAAVDMYRKAIAIFKDVGDLGRQLRTTYNAALSFCHIREFGQADDMMAQYKELQTDGSELRRAVANFEATKAAAQSPNATFAGFVGSPSSISLLPVRGARRGSAGGGRAGAGGNLSSGSSWRAGVGPEPASMLEFGFENLRWSDVCARVSQGLVNIDAVVSYVKTRAATEERYGKGLKEVSESGATLTGMFGFIGSKGDVNSECNTLFAAIEASKQAANKECSRRLQFSTFLEHLVEQLVSMRNAHNAEQKRLLSRGKDVIAAVKAASKRLSKAAVRLDKVRAEESDTKKKVEAVHDGTATGLSDYEIKRRTKAWSSATMEVAQAEEALQQAAAELVTSRKQRDTDLRNNCRILQHLEEERLSCLIHVLRLISDADENVAACTTSDLKSSSELIGSAYPHSDLRLFLHNRIVDSMLRQLSNAQRLTRERAKAKEAPEPEVQPVPIAVEEPKPSGGLSMMAAMFKKTTMFGFSDGGSSASNGSGGGSGGGNTPTSTSVTSSQVVEDDDEGEDVIPVSVPACSRSQYSGDTLRRTEDMNPLVDAWVEALFAGKGCEVYSAIGTLSPVPGIDDGEEKPTTVTTTTTSATTTTEVTASEGKSNGNDRSYEIDGEVAVEVTTDADGNPVPTAHVDVLFRHVAGRNAFLRSLNKQRGTQQDATAGFDRLVKVMTRFLDISEADGDVACCKMAMIMSETFYKHIDGVSSVEPGVSGSMSPSRRGTDAAHEFVQRHITGHSVWQNAQFWEEAFYRSVREEVAKLCVEPTGNLTSTPGGEVNTNSTIVPGSLEWQYTYSQIVFGQLGSYALNMKTFGLPRDKVFQIVNHLAVGNGLSADQLQALMATSMHTD